MTIRGIVVKGRQLGRELGFPTANIVPGRALHAEPGVWVAKATVGGRSYGAVANLGVRPSVDDSPKDEAGCGERPASRSASTLAGTFSAPAPLTGQLLLEVHLFDYEGDLYGQQMEVELLRRLRPERKFATPEELRAQIARDAEQAKEILKAEKI